MKEKIDLKIWIDEFTEEILNNVEYLNGLDTAIGDGDHGTNMKNGVTKLSEYITMDVDSGVNSVQNPKELFNAMSVLFLTNTSGASGPLYAAAFKSMSNSWDEETSLEEIVYSGVIGIKNIGHCDVGDKTMFDVWHGVHELLQKDNLTVESIDKIADSTENMQAKKGRASFFYKRSLGHIDPGAKSSSYFFKAMLKAQ